MNEIKEVMFFCEHSELFCENTQKGVIRNNSCIYKSLKNIDKNGRGDRI